MPLEALSIAVASGKGGTGKTTLATNLAAALPDIGIQAAYLDCDVEEPNGHLFLKPKFKKTENVGIPTPKIDMGRCTLCGECQQICQFNAILTLPKTILVFPELCHGCGGCSLICKERAISEYQKRLGVVQEGIGKGIFFAHGILDIGQHLSPPLIRAVKNKAPHEGVIILDSPPGSSCPVVESVKDADFVILVTEPTPFGLHDLKIAVQMLIALGKRFAVVVNRFDIANGLIQDYCDRNNIKILAQFPNRRDIAEAYSQGKLLIDLFPEMRNEYLRLFSKIEQEAYSK